MTPKGALRKVKIKPKNEDGVVGRENNTSTRIKGIVVSKTVTCRRPKHCAFRKPPPLQNLLPFVPSADLGETGKNEQ